MRDEYDFSGGVRGKYAAAINADGRAAECAIIERAEPPVDLASIRQSGADLDQFIDRDIAICPTVRLYLDTRKPVYPFSEAEVAGLEAAMELHHGIEAPYYIHMSLALQQLGRAWQFEPDAAHFLTGFTLGKE